VRDILRMVSRWWPFVLRSTHEGKVAFLEQRIEALETRFLEDAARIRALVWWRGEK